MIDMDSRTSKATKASVASRRLRRLQRLAEELRAAGWFAANLKIEVPDHIRHPAPGLQPYATNGLGETYRVIDWTGAGEPILSGGRNDFVGLRNNYLYTIGPSVA